MVRVLAQLWKGAGRAPHFLNLIVKEHICQHLFIRKLSMYDDKHYHVLVFRSY